MFRSACIADLVTAAEATTDKIIVEEAITTQTLSAAWHKAHSGKKPAEYDIPVENQCLPPNLARFGS